MSRPDLNEPELSKASCSKTVMFGVPSPIFTPILTRASAVTLLLKLILPNPSPMILGVAVRCFACQRFSKKHRKPYRKEKAFLPENQNTYIKAMKNQNVSWPILFQPFLLIQNTLKLLALLLCLHASWSSLTWTVYDHVNQSIPAVLHMEHPFELWPTSLKVATDLVMVFFLAAFASRPQWLVWSGLSLVVGWGLGSLLYHLVTAAF